MKSLVAFIILLTCGLCRADEPAWNSEQRAENRQVVVEATVVKIEKVRDQAEKVVHLMRAELKVGSIRKGRELVGDSQTIEVLYETSPLGGGFRCPTYPVLKAEQKGRFYLRFDNGLSEKQSFVIGMGSDVEPLPLDSGKVMPELVKTLAGNPSFDDISRILGEPRVDTGSGIHNFVYLMDQGESVIVGTSLEKKLLYVKRGEDILYRNKSEP